MPFRVVLLRGFLTFLQVEMFQKEVDGRDPSEGGEYGLQVYQAFHNIHCFSFRTAVDADTRGTSCGFFESELRLVCMGLGCRYSQSRI